MHGTSFTAYQSPHTTFTKHPPRVAPLAGRMVMPEFVAHALTPFKQASMRTIINENADKMPTGFKLIGQHRVDNLKVLLLAMNSNHMRELANFVISFSTY